MSQSTDEVVTIRRKFDTYFGWAASVFILGLTVFILLYPYPDKSFESQIESILIGLPLLWVGWLATVHPKIIVGPVEMVVVNWFTRSHVPWSAVSSIDVDNGLFIILHDGRRLSVASGAGSLASSVAGSRLQMRMKDQIERVGKRSNSDSVVGSVRTVLDIKPIPFLLLAAACFVVGWLAV